VLRAPLNRTVILTQGRQEIPQLPKRPLPGALGIKEQACPDVAGGIPGQASTRVPLAGIGGGCPNRQLMPRRAGYFSPYIYMCCMWGAGRGVYGSVRSVNEEPMPSCDACGASDLRGRRARRRRVEHAEPIRLAPPGLLSFLAIIHAEPLGTGRRSLARQRAASGGRFGRRVAAQPWEGSTAPRRPPFQRACGSQQLADATTGCLCFG
jgi:hypothetical protein